jgi:hypothetical protein
MRCMLERMLVWMVSAMCHPTAVMHGEAHESRHANDSGGATKPGTHEAMYHRLQQSKLSCLC